MLRRLSIIQILDKNQKVQKSSFSILILQPLLPLELPFFAPFIVVVKTHLGSIRIKPPYMKNRHQVDIFRGEFKTHRIQLSAINRWLICRHCQIKDLSLFVYNYFLLSTIDTWIVINGQSSCAVVSKSLKYTARTNCCLLKWFGSW